MTDQPFTPPEAPTVSVDGERIRQAGEMGFITLILFAANACCGLLVFVVPLTGAVALYQLQGTVARTEVDRVWRRVALAGGWSGVVLGGLYSIAFALYVLFLIAVIAMPGMAESFSDIEQQIQGFPQ